MFNGVPLAGLVLDIIVIFFYRLLRNALDAFRSRSWPTSAAVIEGSSYERGYACAEFEYSYTVGGEKHLGTYGKPFWRSNDAYDMVRRVALPARAIIRYDPDRPSRSVLREQDQKTS